MTPQDGEKQFHISLNDEVVRGAIVTYQGQILPTAPRPAPPPPPPANNAKTAEAATQTLALTPWQKATREVATVTAGMGSVLALGKTTGPLFMGNLFTFALAGLVGYRAVWGVVPALHSPLMSVTNAISGRWSSFHRPEGSANPIVNRNGWYRWLLYHGRWITSTHFPATTWFSVSPHGIRQCFWWIRHHKANAGYV